MSTNGELVLHGSKVFRVGDPEWRGPGIPIGATAAVPTNDGDLLFTRARDRGFELARMHGDDIVARCDVAWRPESVVQSPNGRWVAAWGAGWGRVFAVSNLAETMGGFDNVQCLAWLGDETLIVARAGGVALVAVSDGNVLRSLPISATPRTVCAVGSSILVTTDDSLLVLRL
jgi:hypothetical protein